MLARVSNIEAFRYWRDDEEATPADLVARLTSFEPTPQMMAGTAFHAALEHAVPGDYDTLHAHGYTFQMPTGTLVLPSIRELRLYGDYGPLTVTGCVDALEGKRVDDHKTTGRFDPERYLSGCPWKFYLDLTGGDVFRWNVFEIRELKPMVYEVSEPQTLEQYRYPGMHEECARLAAEFYEFARAHMPDYNAMALAA